MRKIKFIITTILASLILGHGIFAYDFHYDYNPGTNDPEESTEIGFIIKSDVVENQDSVLNRLLDLFNLSNQSRYDSGTSKAVYYAKMIVNLLISLTSFIALIMLIYAFYMIFFSKDDSGITKAKQMIKGVVLAIVIMGLSWFIVSLIFWIQKGSANPQMETEPAPTAYYKELNNTFKI